MGEERPAARPSGEADGPRSDEPTLADEDWPVAPQYQVTPDPPLDEQPRDERGAVAIEAPRRSWAHGPPRAAVLLSVLALILMLGAAAAWLATGLDEPAGGSPAASPNTPGAPEQPTPPPTATDTTAPTTTTTAAQTGTTGTETQTSTAEPQVSVPSVVGLRASVAVRRVRAADLRATTRIVKSSQPTGTVVAQDPSPGAELERGEVVDLRVAKRPEPTTVRLPRLVGLTSADAKSRLRALGLHWSVVETTSAEDAGTVVGQRPSAGADVRKGATITLRISTGPALVTVPDVTGLDEAAARAKLEDAGFEVSVVDEPTADPSEDGMVVSQDPVAGADGEKGSLVTITVARLS